MYENDDDYSNEGHHVRLCCLDPFSSNRSALQIENESQKALLIITKEIELLSRQVTATCEGNEAS